LGFREAETVGAKTLPFNMQPWLLCMQDMKVVKHRVRGDSEGSVSKALLEEYFNRAGRARQKRKKSRLQPLPAEAEDEGSLPTLLLPDSSPEDLQAVTCATHKEDRSDVMLAKTAGILCVCLSSGIIMLMQEVCGSESLPQRYFCLAAAKAAVPEAVLLVHDDSCHLYKYCLKRKEAGWRS